MFDNLRDLSDNPLYQDDEQNEPFGSSDSPMEKAASGSISASPAKKRRKTGNFLGMTSLQRFILSVILMIVVCLMGSMAMVVLGRMSLFGI